ncbi:MAG: F0F1 ATP synthase subunit gamma [Anaerolineae bacterium]|nr:F0F1 ATP synthase subunit gamma [Anaerolineae bacterium]
MVQTIEALRDKIRRVKEMQSVVTTMKVLAAVNIRQYEAAVKSLTKYNDTIEMGLEIALRHRPEEIKIAQRVLSGPLGAIVLGSDQGMVGQFNQVVADHAFTVLRKGRLRERECTLLAVGRRVAARLEQADLEPIEILSTPSSLAGLTPMVQNLLIRIENWRETRGIEQILLFYNMSTHGASYRAKALQLLPIDPRWLEELEKRRWPSRGLPTYTLKWDVLFAALIREYFFASLYRAFAESLASENASRLSSMQAAEQNIEDELDQLNIRYHHLRQTSITEELMDVVAGYEALARNLNASDST